MSHDANDADDARDRRLADLLDSWTSAPSPQRPSLEALCREHPDLADELRNLWGAVMVVDAIAERGPEEPATATAPAFRASLAAPYDEAPPRRLGDFELLDELGRGGMGVVYRARQDSLGRDVAVKVLLSGTRASYADQARFQAEVESAARLDHPNIVPIFDTGQSDGWRYFGMKLVEGETLATQLATGPMPHRAAAELVEIIAQAIAYAHQQGVVHRDLKPANILIDRGGAPHITDFGLAKSTSSSHSLTNTGAILGTPSYMAPEQAAGDRGEVGPASDVFSLGAILYALLTGRPPFQGATPVDTVLALLEQDPPPPRLLNPKIPRDLEMIVMRCLQKPPELRYASAEAL
ncbi:MAG: serine/threonine protein kinase, partial [Planctomycetales bacterium]|nr:serine/threonine protein kinase [Planctomycetales bacterium]